MKKYLTSALVLMTFFLQASCGSGVSSQPKEEKGIIVYYKNNFDQDLGGFRGARGLELDLSKSEIEGKALEATVKKQWKGPGLSINIQGSKDLRMAFMAKGVQFRRATLNVFDNKANDNTTPNGYRFLPDDRWVPVLYCLDRFRYNGRGRDYVDGDTDYSGMRFWLEKLPKTGEAKLFLDNFVVYRGPDTSPPDKIEDLKAKAMADGVRLSWSMPHDNAFPMVYAISRSRDGGPFKKIAETYYTEYLDRSCGSATCTYRVLAVDFENNIGEWSNVVKIKGKAPIQEMKFTVLERDRENYAEHVREIHKRGAGKVNKGLVCLYGDSLTGPTIYPYMVAGALGVYKVNAHGFAGVTTGWGVKNLEQQALSKDNPEFLLVMFGTNNVRGRMRDRKVFRGWVNDLLTIAKKAEAQGIVTILGTIPPRGFKDSESKPEAVFNKMLVEAARAHKIPVAYVFEEIQKSGDRRKFIWRDGVHWTPKGMEVAARAWAKTMRQVEFVLRDAE